MTLPFKTHDGYRAGFVLDFQGIIYYLVRL